MAAFCPPISCKNGRGLLIELCIEVEFFCRLFCLLGVGSIFDSVSKRRRVFLRERNETIDTAKKLYLCREKFWKFSGSCQKNENRINARNLLPSAFSPKISEPNVFLTISVKG